MAASKKKWLVFVSHSGEDTWIARQIAREIADRGATPFLDEADVEIGAEFEENIRDFIDKANELLVLFTPWAFERSYVWIEIGAAWQRRIPIVVALHGLSARDFQAHPNAPVFLKKRDIIRLNEIDQYFKQLSSRSRGRRMADSLKDARLQPRNRTHDVFLSYAHSSADQPWVREFQDALAAAGVTTFFDAHEIMAGVRWGDQIAKALRQSRVLIMLLTPESIRSPSTFFELGAALADQKLIVPVLAEGVDPSDVPVFVRQFQSVREKSPEAAAKRVAEAVFREIAYV
jgi:TIR domain